MTDADLNSECATTSSTDKRVVSRNCCAGRTRLVTTHSAGAVPTRSRNLDAIPWQW